MNKNFRLILLGFLSLLSMSLLIVTTPALAEEGTSQFFSPTGHSVSGKFLNYWNNHGGLATFGYPITGAYYEKDPISGKSYLTQWFERNRFELHPEFANTQYEVLLGLLGRQITTGRESETPFLPAVSAGPSSPSQIYYSQTGHNLSGVFKNYWDTTGGLALYGYPISETFREQNPSDGQTYLVQYFERNRFELHPNNQPPYNVLLGLLGDQLHPVSLSPVIDNRTKPLLLLTSYYNAINLKDYNRAYNYWRGQTSGQPGKPGSFTKFASGFSDTVAVGLMTGPVQSDGTAGTIYYSVPVVIFSSQTDGTKNHYYGCFRIAQVDAQIGDNPLPNPLSIDFAKIYAASTTFTETMLMPDAIKLTTPPNFCVA